MRTHSSISASLPFKKKRKKKKRVRQRLDENGKIYIGRMPVIIQPDGDDIPILLILQQF